MHLDLLIANLKLNKIFYYIRKLALTKKFVQLIKT